VQKVSKRSPWIQAGARLLLVLAWAPAAFLAAELAERARIEAGNRQFPAEFQARFAGAHAVRFAEQEPDAPPARSAVSELTPPPASTMALDGDGVDGAALAAARGETIFLLDDAGRLVEAHGESAFELHVRRALAGSPRAASLRRLLDAHLPHREPFSTDYSFLFEPIWRHYRLEGAPGPGGSGFRVIARDQTHSMPPEDLNRAPVPPDSEWLVHLYSYKPDWPRTGLDERTNNFGFRDRDVVTPKPAGVFRVVCIGGSTTEEGRSLDATYPKRVERILRERFGGDVEIINGGIVGATSFTIRTRLDDYLAMEPDLFVYYGGINDISHNFMEIWLEQSGAARKWSERSFLVRRLFNRRLLPEDAAIRAFLRQTTLRNLEAIRIRAREAGAELAVCSVATPDPARVGFRDRMFLDANVAATWGGQGLVHYPAWRRVHLLLNEELRAWSMEGAGPAYFPVAERFTGGTEYFYDTCHATDAGMAEKARVVAALLGDYLANTADVRPMNTP